MTETDLEPRAPDAERTLTDRGDETQRNFRYQHAYGVILLLAAARDELPYVSIWCEHHEDFLAERRDGLYDAFQIKTATPEDGPWVWSRDGLRQSIKRFVRLHRRFPDRLSWFNFVSNVECSNSYAARELGRSPLRLVEALGKRLRGSLDTAFRDLKTYCGCNAKSLEYVLHRLRFQKGPGRDSFEDEIAHRHLSSLDSCRAMSAAQRDRCLDALVQMVYRASSLVVRDPRRHWCAIGGGDAIDPYLRAKRIHVAALREYLSETSEPSFLYAPTTRPLSLGSADERMPVLEQKLIHGGLSEYVDLVRWRAISAERHLIGLAHRTPDEIDSILNQVSALVMTECDEARLDASQQPEPYGRKMLSDVHRRLRRVAEERADMVHRQQYEVLAGIAGLLTEECRIWWSERFPLEALP